MNAVTGAVSWKLVAELRIETNMPTNEPEISPTSPGKAILGLDGKADSSAHDLAGSTGSGIEGRLPANA